MDEMQYPKRIMITGASGFLGRAIVKRLRDEGTVTALGFRHAAGPVRAVDVRDGDAFGEVLAQADPDVVVHCAAYRDPDFCETEREETRRLNVAPVQTLANRLRADAKLVFISTDYVFAGDQPPYREDDERRPVNFYGQSKKEAEDAAAERASSIILRIPLLMGFGPTFAESGFIAKTAQALNEGRAMELDDRTMRFPTDIRDVAEAVAFLLSRDVSGTYHLSGPRGQSQYRWALELADYMGIESGSVHPVSTLAGRKARRPADSQLAVDRIRALGYDRFTDFKEVAGAVLALSQ